MPTQTTAPDPIPPIDVSLMQKNEQPLDFKGYQEPLPLDISKLAIEATPGEEKIEGLLGDLANDTEGLLGETTFRAEQQKAAGLPDLQKNQRDLQTRLQNLINQNQAIPLQVQEESRGRGRTKAGTAAIETSRLRQNTIEALGVKSLFEANQGNIATALNLVENAVAERFNPIKERIAAKQFNLDLLLKSPSLSREVQERALRQKAVQDIQARRIKEQEDNYKLAQAMASAAIKNNPGDQFAGLRAQQVLRLDPTKSNYLEEVFKLIGDFQTNPEEIRQQGLQTEKMKADLALTYANIAKVQNLSQILSIGDAQKLGVPFGTTKEQAIALGKVPGLNEEANKLKENALTSATRLLEMFQSGEGTSAVGKSNTLNSFGFGLLQGTQRADFVTQFNNLKSLLSLDNVKYLKGQGSVSDAERALLEQASKNLSRGQSEKTFESELQKIIDTLSGSSTGNRVTVMSPDGEIGTIPESQLDEALQNGYSQQ